MSGWLLGYPYGISLLLRIHILQSTGEVDEEEVNVSQAPRLVLLFHHGKSMLFAVVVVPKLSGHENVFALDKTLLDCSLDSLPGFLFVLVVVGTIEEPVASFDRLQYVKRRTLEDLAFSRCKRYRLLSPWELSTDQTLPGASDGQRRAERSTYWQ